MRLAFDPVHLHHLGHLIDTYITDLLVSFKLRLGSAIHIVKFRPKQPEKLSGTLAVKALSPEWGFKTFFFPKIKTLNCFRDFPRLKYL